VWLLRTHAKPAEDPWDRLRRIAERQGQTDPKALYAKHRLGSIPGVARRLLSAPAGAGGSGADSG